MKMKRSRKPILPKRKSPCPTCRQLQSCTFGIVGYDWAGCIRCFGDLLDAR